MFSLFKLCPTGKDLYITWNIWNIIVILHYMDMSIILCISYVCICNGRLWGAHSKSPKEAVICHGEVGCHFRGGGLKIQ